LLAVVKLAFKKASKVTGGIVAAADIAFVRLIVILFVVAGEPSLIV
jgi:hypothetical protein